ncbi:MAG: flippase-like domain-containing protein [Clostridia bacterium]|nr:flippase-like domain-containing protein [Clostridia bacterium]
MDRKKIGWGIASLAIAFLTIWTISRQSEYFSFQHLLEVIRTASPFWMVLALLCMFGFIWFEGLAIVRIAHHLGYDETNRGTLYGAADIFFSAITPSASGGQPASAFFMIKDRMPGSVATAVLILNLIMYTLALLTIGLICLPWFSGFNQFSRIVINLGFLLLVVLATCFYLLLKKGQILSGFLKAIVKGLEKIHIVRRGDRVRARIDQLRADYDDCAKIIFGKKKMMVEVYLINLAQRISQMGVSFMVFMGIGRGAREAIKVFILQSFVAIGSNCIPIPGAMGIADYLMIDGFTDIVGQAQSGGLEMVTRGIAFYILVILSGIIVLVNVLKGKRK